MSLVERLTSTKLVTLVNDGRGERTIQHNSVEELLAIMVEAPKSFRFTSSFYTSKLLFTHSDVFNFFRDQFPGDYKFNFLYEQEGELLFKPKGKYKLDENGSFFSKHFTEAIDAGAAIFPLRESNALTETTSSLIRRLLAIRAIERELPEGFRSDFLNDIEKYLKILIENCGLSWELFTQHTEKFS